MLPLHHGRSFRCHGPQKTLPLLKKQTGDNHGPTDIFGVIETTEQVRLEFPNADVFSSSFTNFVNAIREKPGIISSLPVYNEEIGDTWIHGIASDSWKTAANRVMMRERSYCLENGDCSLDSHAFYNFSRLLLKVEFFCLVSFEKESCVCT